MEFLPLETFNMSRRMENLGLFMAVNKGNAFCAYYLFVIQSVDLRHLVTFFLYSVSIFFSLYIHTNDIDFVKDLLYRC